MPKHAPLILQGGGIQRGGIGCPKTAKFTLLSIFFRLNKDLHKIDWDVKELNIHQYENNFLNIFNQILDIHAPLIKVEHPKNQAKRNAKLSRGLAMIF